MQPWRPRRRLTGRNRSNICAIAYFRNRPEEEIVDLNIFGGVMGIDVAWITERHEPIQEVFDPRGYLTALAISTWPSLTSTCVRFIDPWGNTVFNRTQIPVLLSELRSVRQDTSDKETRAHLEKVVRLIERAVDRTHTYIKFIGD